MLIHYEANVASRSHELDRLDSQDHYCVRVIEPSRAEGGVGDYRLSGNGSTGDVVPRQVIVAAVAGAKPSASLGGEGARLASAAAVDAAVGVYQRGELLPGDATAFKGVFKHALRAVADAADSHPSDDIVSFACSLCLVVWDGVRVWYGCAGDSGAIAVNPMGDPFALTRMHRGPSTRQQPLPLYDPFHWEFGYDAGTQSVLMATAGILEQLAEWEPGSCGAAQAYDREWVDLLANRNIDMDDLPALNDAAAKYLRELQAFPMGRDKTVVAMVNSEGISLADYCHAAAKDVTAERLTAMEASLEDKGYDQWDELPWCDRLPWNEEFRLDPGYTVRSVGGCFCEEYEYHLMCGLPIERAFALAADSARKEAESNRAFVDLFIDEADF